jgi:hypothetical protein
MIRFLVLGTSAAYLLHQSGLTQSPLFRKKA